MRIELNDTIWDVFLNRHVTWEHLRVTWDMAVIVKVIMPFFKFDIRHGDLPLRVPKLQVEARYQMVMMGGGGGV